MLGRIVGLQGFGADGFGAFVATAEIISQNRQLSRDLKWAKWVSSTPGANNGAPRIRLDPNLKKYEDRGMFATDIEWSTIDTAPEPFVYAIVNWEKLNNLPLTGVLNAERLRYLVDHHSVSSEQQDARAFFGYGAADAGGGTSTGSTVPVRYASNSAQVTYNTKASGDKGYAGKVVAVVTDGKWMIVPASAAKGGGKGPTTPEFAEGVANWQKFVNITVDGKLGNDWYEFVRANASSFSQDEVKAANAKATRTTPLAPLPKQVLDDAGDTSLETINIFGMQLSKTAVYVGGGLMLVGLAGLVYLTLVPERPQMSRVPA